MSLQQKMLNIDHKRLFTTASNVIQN